MMNMYTHSRDIYTLKFYLFIFWGAKKMKISFILPRKYKKKSQEIYARISHWESRDLMM